MLHNSNRMDVKGSKLQIMALVILLAVNELLCAPVQDPEYSSKERQISENKKDIFLSRGWGAGGMPFSVLYMSPHSSKAPIQLEPVYKAAPLSAPRLREPQLIESPPRTYLKSRRQYSVIPQLFVSYGWAPIGKK